MVIETVRQAVWSTVAWCRDCRLWLPAAQIGGGCWMECDRTLIKRVGWVCSVCEQIEFTKADFNDHGCWSFY